ncbi:MAG TPA: tripartite tricarboxylate transporter substrate binding protein [Thermoanaerobaculia bacterium]|nr:tripartite tricarboxylate transporter substrate binding protein [Thermoanaerobaculia bacterium]
MLKTIFAVVAAMAPFLVHGQEYPSRDIRSICNFAPGSGADIIVRFYSDRLSKLAGKPVVVDNKPGANGSIATAELAKAKPDGHTIMITPASSTIASAPYMFKDLPFDTTKDFAAVTTIASLSFLILVDAQKPIHNLKELVAELKKKPNDGFYGTGNNTGVITAEIFKAKAGLQTTYAPYKTNVQALTDLLQGQLDFISYDATWAAGQVRGGKLRAIGASAARRSVAFPDVPTFAEQGFGDADVTPWWGVVVPAGTPRPIVDKLAGWMNEITNQQETRTFLAHAAFDPFPGSPEQMTELLKTDAARWKSYVEMAKIQPQ